MHLPRALYGIASIVLMIVGTGFAARLGWEYMLGDVEGLGRWVVAALACYSVAVVAYHVAAS